VICSTSANVSAASTPPDERASHYLGHSYYTGNYCIQVAEEDTKDKLISRKEKALRASRPDSSSEVPPSTSTQPPSSSPPAPPPINKEAKPTPEQTAEILRARSHSRSVSTTRSYQTREVSPMDSTSRGRSRPPSRDLRSIGITSESESEAPPPGYSRLDEGLELVQVQTVAPGHQVRTSRTSSSVGIQELYSQQAEISQELDNRSHSHGRSPSQRPRSYHGPSQR